MLLVYCFLCEALPLNSKLLMCGRSPLFLSPQTPIQSMTSGCPWIFPGDWISSVKLPYPVPNSILTPDRLPIPLSSPERSCAPKAWPPPHSLEGSPKIQRETICFPPHPPIPQALLRNFRARRDLDLERGTLSPSGSATEQCDFGRVAFPFWALLSTSVKWE